MDIDILKKIESIKDILKTKKVKFIDLKSMDIHGRIRHLSIPVSKFSEDIFTKGVGIDGSNYGFSSTEKSDFVAVADINSFFIDESESRIVFFINFKKSPESKNFIDQDLRWLTKKCENLVKKLQIGDEILLSPEYEFYIFKKFKRLLRPEKSYFIIDQPDLEGFSSYHIDSPHDKFQLVRDEISLFLEKMGIKVKYHHHEVGERGQQEIEIGFNTPLKTADISLIVKYFSRKIAEKHGLFLTFMPKPISGMAGNGWHVHQYIVKNGESIFFKKGEILSKTGLNYVGGLIRHSRALCAFTNPTINSYKRLTPGYEAPVSIDFGEGDRSSLIRVPSYAKNKKECRIEYRVPDFSSNPYLSIPAMVMAGIDGILNDIDPYSEVKKLKAEGKDLLPINLNEAINSLKEDFSFLLRENVFSEVLIENWIKVKEEEISKINSFITPAEFSFYFDLEKKILK